MQDLRGSTLLEGDQPEVAGRGHRLRGGDFVGEALHEVGGTASGWRIIIVQSQSDLSPVVNVLRSSAHHSPSSGDTLKSWPPALLIVNLAV